MRPSYNSRLTLASQSPRGDRLVTTGFDGILVLDKPGGMTSRAAVNEAQRWFPRRVRIGHTGTLDPLATGVLVLTVGAATRFGEYVQRMVKTYRATVMLGAVSDTDDADGKVTPVKPVVEPTRMAIETALKGFVGALEQRPPAYSAIHVSGERAHELARRGQLAVLQSRLVHVHALTLLDYAYPRLELEARCSAGTYIRSLARDLGEHLGCGGYIAALRRTRVGIFDIADACTLDMNRDEAHARLRPLVDAVAELPRFALDDDSVRRIRLGQSVTCPVQYAGVVEAAAVDPIGHLVAVVSLRDGRAHPTRVVAASS
jgi:tRNA pseudouridine55 synthase